MTKIRVMVIGIGNRYRGDDAAGVMVAERLQQMSLPGVEVALYPNSGPELMDLWQGTQFVIMVDAVRSGRGVGSILKLDGRELAGKNVTSVSSHGFGVIDTVALAEVLGILPARLVIYGIEASTFEPGDEVSQEVLQAVDQVVQLILEELGCTSLVSPEKL